MCHDQVNAAMAREVVSHRMQRLLRRQGGGVGQEGKGGASAGGGVEGSEGGGRTSTAAGGVATGSGGGLSGGRGSRLGRPQDGGGIGSAVQEPGSMATLQHKVGGVVGGGGGGRRGKGRNGM